MYVYRYVAETDSKNASRYSNTYLKTKHCKYTTLYSHYQELIIFGEESIKCSIGLYKMMSKVKGLPTA